MSIPNLAVTMRSTEEASAPEPTGQIGSRPVSVSSSSSSSSSSVWSRIEDSNNAFFKTLVKENVDPAQLLGISYYIPTIQRNSWCISKDDVKALHETFKLCRELPRGSHAGALSGVHHHFDRFIQTFNLLITLRDNTEGFLLYNRDHFDLKYRLAQCYAHADLGSSSPDHAVTLLDEIISDISQSKCKLNGKEWDQQYLSFWTEAISLRASIVAGSNPPKNNHELNISSPVMKLRFLIDSANEFRKMGQDGIAAIYFEKALEEHDEVRKKHLPHSLGIDRITMNVIREFLVDFFLTHAQLSMKTAPKTAIVLYEKALKFKTDPDVLEIVLKYYTSQDREAQSSNNGVKRIKALGRIIKLISAYGDFKSKSTLPHWRKEIFFCYIEHGKERLQNQKFDEAIDSYETALTHAERADSIIDPDSVMILKVGLLKAFVECSSHLHNKGFTLPALNALRHGLEFKRSSGLVIGIAEEERLMKLNEELTAKLGT